MQWPRAGLGSHDNRSLSAPLAWSPRQKTR
jgi:hypothetical protein